MFRAAGNCSAASVKGRGFEDISKTPHLTQTDRVPHTEREKGRHLLSMHPLSYSNPACLLQFQQALERVRAGADVMPQGQLHKVIEAELGTNWRNRMATFEDEPLAAASIGQVCLLSHLLCQSPWLGHVVTMSSLRLLPASDITPASLLTF